MFFPHRQCIECEGHDTLPNSQKIPAMYAVLMDKALFKILLTMLSSKNTDVDDILFNKGSNRSRSASFGQVKIHAQPVQSATFQHRITKMQQQQQQQQQQQILKRKRALSTSSAEDHLLTPNKSMKLMRSPMQKVCGDFNKIATSGSNGPALPSLSGGQGQTQVHLNSSLDINFSVLAAMIFYSVFQYLEQWPAVFVKL